MSLFPQVFPYSVEASGAIKRTESSGAAGIKAFPGQSMGAGEGALEAFAALAEVDQTVHVNNTAYGWHALRALTGLTGVFNATANTAVGSAVINLTGVEGKAGGIYAGGTSNTPMIVFRHLTPGVTGIKTGVAYYVVNGLANSFSVALTHAGAAIKVEGHELEADTEIALLTSTEDNTAIGTQAGLRLTTGGGNTLIGENSGVNLTTGEENTVIGCEALQAQQTVTGNTAIGFRAGNQNTTGTPLIAIGYDSLEQNTIGAYNIAIGNKALQANTEGAKNIAIGHEALFIQTTAKFNTALGNLAGKSITTGSNNLLLGNEAGNLLKTSVENVAVGERALANLETGVGKNVAIGMEALLANKVGENNTALGYSAGEKVTGSGNVFIGAHTGQNKVAVSNLLMIAASNTEEPLIEGVFPNAELKFNTTKISLYKGVAPVSRHATIAVPAETTAANTKAIKELIEAVKAIGIIE